ncbi:MAG: glycosyl hydrolase [Bacteroidales bacterium]|nr:glycosyl hydrolase [Bacteroidales bacterium]
MKENCISKGLRLCALICLVCLNNVRGEELPRYLDSTVALEERVEDALHRLTLEEKVAMVHAQSKFSSPGSSRLGIPEFWMTDGPHGIRPEVMWDEWNQAEWTNDSCTAFPALTCLAATWNPEMSLLYGRSIGQEARYRNKTVLLGPGVNILRTPLNGRNFEYMGEDPYLASVMVVPYVKGVQENGVAACVKHFALNNHEVNRNTTNVIVDDRALYEIYLQAFKAAVKDGGAWSIMGSYNLYKNQQACHNKYLLNDILKGEWGFDGVVVSDWGGVTDTEEAAANGLDMEFGTWTDGLTSSAENAYDRYFLANPYLDGLRDGRYSVAGLDDKVRRILRLAFRTNMDRNRPFGSFATPDHFDAARKIAQEGIVLLKNDAGLLPIDMKDSVNILVVGENAIRSMTFGGGSSSLKVKKEVSPLEGIRNMFGSAANVRYARGYVGEQLSEYNGVSSSVDISESRSNEELSKEAVDMAKKSDYVIFVGGLNKTGGQDCEGVDRASLDLPYGQNELIEALAAANKNLIVVNISGTPVAMPWIKNVPAVLQGWHLGSESGSAIASVLSGQVNPSGKLPMTFPRKLEDVGAHKSGEYPGVARNDGSNIVDCRYNEGLFVGYRWADKEKVNPLFPFGHGLSYTTFKYGKPDTDTSKLKEDGMVTVTVPVTNTGLKGGAETVQLYVRDLKSTLPRPVKELKGFRKVYLEPNETANVTIEVPVEKLAYFDDTRHRWVAEKGDFELLIGSSSRDIRESVKFTLDRDFEME